MRFFMLCQIYKNTTFIMKTDIRKKTIQDSRQYGDRVYHCSLIFATPKNRIIKIVYGATNSREEYRVYLFDGNKFNEILNIYDLEMLPNNTAFLLPEFEIDVRYSKMLSRSMRILEEMLE